MLFMNPVLVPLVVEILLLARTQGLGVAVERVARFVQDPLTIFTTFLLLCYSYGRHMVLVSPWVENVILYLPPCVAQILSLQDPYLELSQVLNRVAARGRAVLVTRSSGGDHLEETSVGRRELLSRITPRVELVYNERIHTKCVELDGYTLITTANIVERELYKLRTGENTLTITRGVCAPTT